MKPPQEIPPMLFLRLLGDAISLDTGIHPARAKTLAGYFASIEEFIEAPLSSRRFLSISGKAQRILAPSELSRVEAFRRRLAISTEPLDDLYSVIEQRLPT